MLKRQFLAFCLDCWNSEGASIRFPRTVKDLLAAAEKGGFPDPFIAFYAEGRADLVERFLALFGNEVDGINREEVRQYAAGHALPVAIREAMAATRAEREELRRLYRRYREKLQEIEADPAEYENPQAEIKRFQQDAALVVEMIKQIDDTYILNFFTDAGLLPNYAFPESGVKFRAIVTFDSLRASGKSYEVREYLRPAAVAIHELAPLNSFYAEGRKLKVSHIELPGREKAIERWQFCDRCGHMALVQTTHYSTTCPQCGSTYWSDSGQQRNMVRFRQAAAWTQDYESRVGDDDDEREQSFYQTGRFFAIDPEQSGHAQLIASLPFGFEYLREVTLREINFGPTEDMNSTVMIADEERSGFGFRICRDCGVVLAPKEDGEDAGAQGIRHTRNCQFRSAQAQWEQIYLYREMKSEALRLLLPVSTMLVEETSASVSAALHLGLRRWLGGDPDHLQILPHTEVGRDGARRRFLVIYDTVPGGTSYLRDLARPEMLHTVLTLARDTLASCPCRNQPEKKACHRCLYSFRSQSKNELLDRSLALAHIQEILDHFHERVAVPSLGDVDMISVLESELEARFIEALHKHAEAVKSWQMTAILHQGKAAWLLTVQGRRWRIEPQQWLGHEEGISTPTRPDFMIRPLDQDGVRPVAVYTDGFAYHVRPTELRGQIGDDIHKRQTIWRSGHAWVWTITWADILAFEGDAGQAPHPFLTSEQQLQLRQLKSVLSSQLAVADGLRQLVNYLAQPDEAAWVRFGVAVAAILLDLRNRRPPIPLPLLEQLAQSLLAAPSFDLTIPTKTPTGDTFYNIVEKSFNRLLVYAHPSQIQQADGSQIVLRLQDRRLDRAAAPYETGWRQFWLLTNLLQFLPKFTAASDEFVEQFTTTSAEQPVAAVPSTDEVNAAWREVFEWVDPRTHPLLESCQKAGIPAPSVGWELLDARQRVVAMAELAWEDLHVAIAETPADERRHFEEAGWRLFGFDDVEAVLAILTTLR
jgi:DEAD/DEAH box helicase domain-containing protein